MVAPTADLAGPTPPLGWPKPTAAGVATTVAFVALFAPVIADLANQWWTNPDAGHGLLLVPVCCWLAWRHRPKSPSAPWLGAVALIAAALLRLVGALAGELFTSRVSLVAALVGLALYAGGTTRLRHWWLPLAVGALAIPLPALFLNLLATPLQALASQLGAFLIEARGIPYRLNGNIIDIPGHRLFVAEACSGLRSLTALLSLGLLAAGMFLRRPLNRALLVGLTIPVAILLNGLRVFLTAFLVLFVDPAFGEGALHLTEGWLIFGVAFVIIAGLGLLMSRLEGQPRAVPSDA